ncbi:MAG: dihydrolipoamide dehydrogenase [Myxococcota bacterium]|jgi:dihydrolipoamide dehydrogenase
MSERHVDVAILGAGTAGLGARRAAKAEGASVVMIDPGPFGTTCARVGCMPSKLLIAAADAAYHASHTDLFGIRTTGVQVDGRAVMARLHRERDRFVGFVNQVIAEARSEGELIEGRGIVIAPGTLQAGEQTVHYKRLVVATGGSPFVPPPFRDLGDLVLTNEEIFELEDLPESVLVVGLGVIGLELGQAFSRLGVRTTLLGVGGGIGPISDPEILASAREVLGAELDLHPDYTLQSVERTEAGASVAFVDSQGRERHETFARVFMAAGRRPNLMNLGLEHHGFELVPRQPVPVDADTLQLAGSEVFLAGDVNNLHPLLHEAADDGRVAGQNAARYPDLRAATRRTPLAVVFSDPQIGIVGQSYRDLGECAAVAGEVDYGDQGRARVQGINKGRVRIYADRHTGVLLGAELFGPRVEHLSHLLAWAIQQRLTVDDALTMPFYHPVVEEGIRTALRNLNANLRRAAPIKCRVSELGVGS